MALIHSINVTVDGRCHHTQVVADEEHHEYVLRLVESAGGVLLGRNTFELFASHWPGVARTGAGSAAEVAFARALEAKPRFVVSQRMTSTEWSGTTFLGGELATELRELQRSLGEDLVVFGSPSLASSLAEADLIDEFHFLVQPIVALSGPILFDRLARRLDLSLIDSRRFASGVLLARYRRQ